ncbi:type IV secretory system conjugative DNA transfer family protein [Paraglaciecola chathamensis]|jgi:defect-in-organelle-trafficking protein DotC|uniref:Defect in organelle trafficking protein DotC n=1 Tax=Paraglaciecola chathamensis TaxID=368405 RepID=A0A8H9IH36_9ALTE|nr:type IV secretory system conjugative DNA transfer family protein [Paraglaciecola oceanifecundans]AEE25258.1 hypothetical protein Glaag_4336 [Glaciecola sp. 4H-3-7+YE-5]GGZ77426.1 hypothetical protein GCM10011274_39390 [Paraglaciecola oceanifecundans]|tara:strand:+ start:4257 stop:5105 length:849 start_codon:yes stop_codon:yes gene_type:complete
MRIRTIALCIALNLTGPAHAAQPIDTLLKLNHGPSREELDVKEKLIDAAISQGSEEKDPERNNARFEQIEDQARQWGNDEGMYYFHSKNQKRLEDFSTQLDKTVDFNQFVVNGNMLLPTVQKTIQLFEKNSSREARRVTTSYTLDDKAEVVMNPPSWREYLTFPIEKPEMMPTALMPRTKEEEDAFLKAFSEGWELGRKQAKVILDESFSRLENKINGLYEFRFANLTNVVSMPKAEVVHEGVILDSDGQTIYVDDVRFKINHDAYFNDIKKWRPVFVEREQ